MSSQLTSQDKQRLLRGITKKVGQKPYEAGLFGDQGIRDFVLVELYDSLGNFIEYKDLSTIEANLEVDDNYIKLFPGTHLKSFGYDAGRFNLRYRFLRSLAGSEDPVLMRTKVGFEDEVYQITPTADNIYIDDTGKIFKGTQEQYNQNPDVAEQLLLTNYKYNVDAVSPTRTEIRLNAKNINDGRYIEDFQKLQESVRIDDGDSSITFIKVLNLQDPPPGFSAGSPPPQPQLNAARDLEINPSAGGFRFTSNMVGGTLTIPNVFKVGTEIVDVRTDINIIKNSGFEDIEIDENTAQPTIIDAGWDQSVHSDAVKLVDWTSGFNQLDTGIHAGSSPIGYHAKFVRNEGLSGGNCLKFIDQNNLYIDYDLWPTIDGHRELSVRQRLSELQSLGASIGDEINIQFDMKSTKAGKGVEVEIQYPGEIFIEDQPSVPPEGYFDPFNPYQPTEEIPTSPPAGFLANTPGNASTIEDQPPSKTTDIITTFGLEFFAPTQDVTTTSTWGGDGAWIVTNIQSGAGGFGGVEGPPGGNDVITWSPNLGSETYSKIGELSQNGEWKWDGISSWVPVIAGGAPSVPAGVASPEDFNNLANGHPYQFPGQGIPHFQRNNTPGQNTGWQTGTIVGQDKIILIKDDLIWLLKQSFTANFNDVELFRFDEWFPSVRNFVIEETGKTLYEDIFENGYIQSISRTRKTNSNGIRSDYYLVYYSNGSGENDCNRAFMVEKGSDEIGGGGVDDGLKKWSELDGDFNNVLNESGGQFETMFRKKDNKFLHYFAIKGSNQYWRMGDGDGDFFEEGSGGTFFDEDYPAVFDGSQDDKGFAGLPSEWDVAFSKGAYSGHWSNWSCIVGDTYYKMNSDAGDDGVDSSKSIDSFAYGAGEVGTGGTPLTFGVRNPAADNYGYAPPDDPEGRVGDSTGIRGLAAPIYDDGTEILSFDTNPKKIGVRSQGLQWEWDGEEWNTLAGPPVYTYTSLTQKVFTTEATAWGSYQLSFEIPDDWNPIAEWFLKINGHNAWSNVLSEDTSYGITWVDNLFADFTLTNQQSEIDTLRSFNAKITNVKDGGTTITVDKSFEDAANALGDSSFETYLDGNNTGTYPEFNVSYLVYNPYDLRTYLKFGNRMFLTTNFKKDVTSNPFPYSVTYKLYEPLPSDIQRLDECIVVKEMSDPINENVEIVEFVDTDPGDIVLKSPDIMNVESPIQRRTLDYKSQGDILSGDALISDSLQNEFLSQSMDSVDINVDHSAFENFINFSSATKRIDNFKLKLEQIEGLKITSASYIGVSGSSADKGLYHTKIREIKNNFDPFEKYMYFESSSYVTSSIGEFFDNAWPKVSGDGTFNNEYVLAHTTSSQAEDWYVEQIESASLYDLNNPNKLSNVLPGHIRFDDENETYLRLVDMIGHHFDSIWVYIKALGDTYDRREKLTEGISKDLLMSVGESLGWKLNDGKDTISLARYALGKEVTGSSFSNYSDTSERDISREVWSRIINNMPYFLKHKGTIKAIKGLISAYGIPSTILRVKEYGGPDLPDNATPQFEIARKFTKALDFRNGQFVKTIWTTDDSSNRIPDTIEFRFRAATGSNQILVEKEPNSPNVSSSFYIRLKDNDSVDDFGHVSFQLSGSDGLKEISSSNFPVYNGDFYSVMVRRMSGSDSMSGISQSIELHVGHYDAGRSKIDKFSTSVMDLNVAASSSYIGAYATPGEIYIGGKADDPLVGVQFSGSIMEYRHWTEILNTGSFKNHIGNPKAFDGNTISSSYNNMVLRYSFDDNKDLSSDTDGIRDVSANQTTTYSGSHDGFTGNFFRNVTDETKTFIPSIGALRRVTNKIRIEDNPLKPGYILSHKERATKSAYDTAPNDSNKVGVFFAPTDVINNDIINSVANLNFDNFLGDPRDRLKLDYRGLKEASNHYWKKYTSPNNFWDYIRLLKYYDQSLFPQIRKMIPARAKPNLGILVEPNIFERPKTIIGRTPEVTTPYFSQSIDVQNEVVIITGSYNAESFTINDYQQQVGEIKIYGYHETGSFQLSSSGEFILKEATGSEGRDNFLDRSIWQRLKQPGDYSDVTMSFGDIHYNEFEQPSISGSRLRNYNQKEMKFFSTPASASIGNSFSSSFFYVDIDNLTNEVQAIHNSYYAGVLNTKLTTQDGGPPVEVTITSPTRLVTKDTGESSLDTGEGLIAKFKPKKRKVKGGLRKRRSSLFGRISNAEDAIRIAEERKGDFLTLEESQKELENFRKNNKIKKKRRKRKRKKRGALAARRLQVSLPEGLNPNIVPPPDFKSKKKRKPKRKKRKRRR